MPALTAMEAMVIWSRACGRRIPTVNWRMAWNHRQGTRPGARASSMVCARSTTSASWPSEGQRLPDEQHEHGAGDTGEGGHGEAGADDLAHLVVALALPWCPARVSWADSARADGGRDLVADGGDEADAHGAQLVEEDDGQSARGECLAVPSMPIITVSVVVSATCASWVRMSGTARVARARLSRRRVVSWHGGHQILRSLVSISSISRSSGGIEEVAGVHPVVVEDGVHVLLAAVVDEGDHSACPAAGTAAGSGPRGRPRPPNRRSAARCGRPRGRWRRLRRRRPCTPSSIRSKSTSAPISAPSGVPVPDW